MKRLLLRIGFLAVASAGPMAFPFAQMGYAPLSRLALFLVLPSAAALIAAPFAMRALGFFRIGSALGKGLLAGALATVALEAVRYSGFRLGFMPGNLPELMGVLLLDRFALGPSIASDLAGFAYHYYNGAAFGAVFALVIGCRSRWWAIPYGVAIGLGFLVSPVVQSLGVGLFGKDFGWHFAATVITAHAAFGAILGACCGGEACARKGSRSRSGTCPECGGKGAFVERLTMEHLLLDASVPKIGGEPYFFCRTSECDVVYFSNSVAARRFRRTDLKTRVGIKETNDPIPLCYCFGHTAASIREEIEQTGKSTAVESIRRDIQAGRCQCEIRNPSGKCCLGEVMRAVRKAENLSSGSLG